MHNSNSVESKSVKMHDALLYKILLQRWLLARELISNLRAAFFFFSPHVHKRSLDVSVLPQPFVPVLIS